MHTKPVSRLGVVESPFYNQDGYNPPLWIAASKTPHSPLHFLLPPPPLASGHSDYAHRFKKTLTHSTSSVSAETRNASSHTSYTTGSS